MEFNSEVVLQFPDGVDQEYEKEVKAMTSIPALSFDMEVMGIGFEAGLRAGLFAGVHCNRLVTLACTIERVAHSSLLPPEMTLTNRLSRTTHTALVIACN